MPVKSKRFPAPGVSAAAVARAGLARSLRQRAVRVAAEDWPGMAAATIPVREVSVLAVIRLGGAAHAAGVRIGRKLDHGGFLSGPVGNSWPVPLPI